MLESIREKSEEIDSLKSSIESEGKNHDNEINVLEARLRGEVKKVNEAVGVLKTRIVELERSEIDLNVELNRQAQEW